MNLLELVFFDNTLKAWSIAALVFAGTSLGVWLLIKAATRAVARLTSRTDTRLDDAAVDVVRRTKWWLLFALGLFFASLFLSLPETVERALSHAAVIAVLVQSGIWVGAIVALTLAWSRERQMETSPAGVTTLNAIGFVSKILVWSMVVLLALQNLGVDVTALVAGLGVGGVAVALAVQNILGDLFASLSIVFDEPFAVGDFLAIGEHMGSVEHVGLKTTRIRSLSGEQLVFSNSDLLGSRIRNFGRMYQRRVVFPIGVTYQTPRKQLEEIPQILRKAVESQTHTRFDRAHFKAYGDFALNFETVYYVELPDYNLYMDVQQAINLYIHEQFENRGIAFAYPTQTLFLQGTVAQGA